MSRMAQHRVGKQRYTMSQQTILILDDHDIVRFGLETLVSERAELALIGSAASLRDGLRLIEERKPALVISDMTLQDSRGLDTVRAVVQAQGSRHVLVISMHDEMLYGEQVLALGARGYVMKDAAHAVAMSAALSVLQGECWVSSRLASRMIGKAARRTARPSDTASGMADLSLRELEVLSLLKDGSTTKQIAHQLGLSARTVDIHRANIKRKLGLRTGAELIAFASANT